MDMMTLVGIATALVTVAIFLLIDVFIIAPRAPSALESRYWDMKDRLGANHPQTIRAYQAWKAVEPT